MTTGRINQVTILNAGGAQAAATPRGAGQSSSLRGARGPRPAGYPGAMLHRALPGHPIAPTEFPKGPSTAPRSSAGAPSQGVISAPQEEDTVRRTTSRGTDNLPGLTSKCLGRVVPIGQSSTDSNRAYQAEAGRSSGAIRRPTAGSGAASAVYPRPSRIGDPGGSSRQIRTGSGAEQPWDRGLG